VALSVVGGVDEAQFVATSLGAGQHSVTALYSGDTHVGGSSGSLPSQTVNGATTHPGTSHPTNTTLASSLGTATAGQDVTFTAIVSPDGTSGHPSGSVTFTIDGVSYPSVSLRPVKGHDEATFSIASLAEGKHTVTAAYSGDASFAASAAATPFVETVVPAGADGPRIKSVKRFGVHMEPTVLKITFDEALDPASAVRRSNYRIKDPSGRIVRIKSAVLDATTNTVTLRFAERISIHHPYHLTVIGTGKNGIRNTLGMLLDGTSSGTADGNYTAPLTWRNLVLTPAELANEVRERHATPAGALNHHFLKRSH
jgi:hypothetical protein